MRIEVIKVEQPIGYFYLSKLDANKLYGLSKADIADMDRVNSLENEDEVYIGSQRQLMKKKVDQIKRYVETTEATFPASIILNIPTKYLLQEGDGWIEIVEKENTFQIIDGQHRLTGFEEYSKNFELPISIFVGLEEHKQSQIFRTINSTQTKVNPSLNFYLEANDPIWTPRKMVVKIAQMFATDIKSPLHKKIKFNIQNDIVNNKVSTISLQTFGKAILDMLYDDKFFYDVRAAKEKNILEGLEVKTDILWPYYRDEKENTLYKILYNYFTVIKQVFPEEWDSKNSILIKSTGYNALMKLFRDLYMIGYEEGRLTEEFFYSYMIKAKPMEGKFNTNCYGGSGWQASNILYKDLAGTIGIKKSEED